MRAIVTSWALTLVLVACGSATQTPASAGNDDVPKGKSYRDFLGSGQPERPADTKEADKMTMHVIDIGQGLGILFEFPCGAILVDTGGEKNPGFDSSAALSRYLEAFFARRSDLGHTLDSLVVTHPHIDHTRGIDVVVAQFRVENVITNGQEHDDLGGRPQLDLHAWVAKNNKDPKTPAVGFERITIADIPHEGLRNEVIDPIEGCKASAVDPVITALWGAAESLEEFSNDPNNHSVVLRIDFGKSSVMMTGDLELEGLDQMSRRYGPELLDVDVYVVGHHGSKNATAPHMMAAMSPKIAVISAGPYDRDYPWTARKYGHPNVRAVNELRNPRYGVSWYRDSKRVWLGVSGAWKDERKEVFKQDTINRAIYNTGWDGTIDVNLYDNGWIEVETERKDTKAAARR